MTEHAVPPVLVDLAQIDNEYVLQRIDSSVVGLSKSDAEVRLQKYCPNAVAHDERKNLAIKLRNPLNLLLLTLACVSHVMGNREAAISIFVMVMLSESLAFLQERRSNKASERLHAMVHATSTVSRKANKEAEPSWEANAAPAMPAPLGSEIKEIPDHLLVP